MPKAQNLEKLIERKAKLDAKIQAIRSREMAKARKDDTRRKILVGSIVLEAVQKNQEVRAWLDGLLAKKLTRADDRALFDLGQPDNSSSVESPKAHTTAEQPETKKTPKQEAASAPVRYPVFIFQADAGFGAWLPDFPSLGFSGRDKDSVLGQAIEAVHGAVNNDQLRPASDEKTARQQFTVYAGQKYGSTPTYTLEWVAVE